MKNTIVNTKESKITVNSSKKRVQGKCKPVLNMTTGEIYASAADAAIALKASVGNVSMAATGKIKTVKRNRLCYFCDISYHIDEIFSNISMYYEIYKRYFKQYEIEKKEIEKARKEKVSCEEKCEKAKKIYEAEMAKLLKVNEKLNKLELERRVG